MRALTTTILLLTLSAGAVADMNMKPGLWEHSFKMSGGAIEQALEELRQQMEAMPPEQRAMMERMMASQGVSMDFTSGTLQTCVTPEEAASGFVPQHDENCQHRILEQSSNRIRVSFTCDGNPPTSGEGEVIFHSPTSFSGKSQMTVTMQGQRDTMTMEQSGKWLSDDCGGISP